MDKYGQIGPEKGEYGPDVKRAARLLRMGATVHLAHAHRGSRFDVILAMTNDIIPLVSGDDEDTETRPLDAGTIFVAIIGKGAYTFGLAPWLAPWYIAEKLDLTEVDAEAIGGLLKLLHDEICEICGREEGESP